MNDYHKSQQQLSDDELRENKAISTPLPTDKELSLLVRSYQDKNGSKSKAIGIAKALQHLIVDIKVPTSLFGEKTYSSLMYCAASPKEARRIMKMMEENGFSPGPYAYSILINIHGKKGDFRGADEVLSEMKYENVEPTLAAYTSLLAACYKVINTPSMPQSIKAEAGDLGWERWKDMRISGIDADVMAYGAIIRIMAARGLPESAINLIEEMQTFEVKPTTLIFTSSLRSVARSHANALRFQGGFSTKNKRREKLALHHGKMTRKIVALAEQAQVEQDDGFTSALMICAATAGDSATTKAIYLASEVRKLEHLRTIGGPGHLKQFQEFDDPTSDEVLGIESGIDNLSLSDGMTESLDSRQSETNDKKELIINGEHEQSLQQNETSSVSIPRRKRKQRKDTRRLNALLRANANAMEEKGLGDMWEGPHNKGFLDENSLRLINARYKPQYVDKSIPGTTDNDSGSDMVWDDDDDAHRMGKRLRRKKFMGLLEDTQGNTIDDLDPALYNLLVEGEDPLFDKDDYDSENSSSVQSFEFNGNEIIDIPTKSTKVKGEGETLAMNVENYDKNGTDHVEVHEDVTEETGYSSNRIDNGESSALKTNEFIPDVKKEIGQENFDLNNLEEMSLEDLNFENLNLDQIPDDILAQLNDEQQIFTSDSEKATEINQDLLENIDSDSNIVPTLLESDFSLMEPIEEKDELDLILYGMPETRIKKVREEFKNTVGDPSILNLVPLLRENMPATIDLKWLREKNLQDAQHVIEKAKEDKVVDIHLLDSMLQVLAKSESVDEALAFYDEQYSIHDLVSKTMPNEGSHLFKCSFDT